MSNDPVLLSWIAVKNDSLLEVSPDGVEQVGGRPGIKGPTLTLLFDESSPFAGKVKDVVLLRRSAQGNASDRERDVANALIAAIRERDESIRVDLELWEGEDPTDHVGIFEFLRKLVPQVRRRFAGRKLVIHVSPGTPSMQTIWVLMGETGFVEPPFTLVQSFRPEERRGRPAVVPVTVGIETFYKSFKASRPRQVGSEDQGLSWDPAHFRSDSMKRVFAEARRFAQLNVPVLITGERGTGKTTLANWIRSNSPFQRDRRDARWPSVACGQYSPETMRAELFGYKKGAFTGANEDRDGLLAAAHQDTLFLDEVGDVSRDLQRLLIRAIEEKSYYPLGDDKARQSDFRLLTATNIDDGELRRRLDPDFLDRISLFSLKLPPLREVPEELPWLWDAVYAMATRRAGVPKRSAELGAEHHRRVVAQLQRDPLPGNLRELFGVAYRVLAARADAVDQLSPSDATAYGLEALQSVHTRDGAASSSSSARAVAGAFAQRTTIDDLLSRHEPLQTDDVLSELKTFLAREIRRVASNRNLKPEDLCDKSDRTLQSWSKGGAPTPHESSDGQKKSSES